MADPKKVIKGGLNITKRLLASRDEADDGLNLIRSAGRTAHEQEAAIRAAKTAQAKEQMARLPARNKKANTEAGLYHPVGGGIKLSKPTYGMHSTTVPDPMFNAPDIGIITPEQLVKEEAALFPLVGDRAAAGRYLTHVGENELANPVRLTGGPRYMDANYNPLDPEQSAAWESGAGRVTSLGNQAARAGQDGRPVYGVYTAGSGTNTDFNVMGANALYQQIAHSKITKKAEREFDRAMREGTKDFPPLPDWPGIRSPEAYDVLLDKSNGIVRTKLFGTMGKENFQSMGFPDVPSTRKAIVEPELLDVPTNQAGYRLARMDATGRIIENPLIPSDYPKAMAGKVAGRLDVPADYKDVWQSHFDARRLLSQPESGDYYSFARAHPIQYADDEWLNRLMEQRFATERKIKEGEYKEGGEVDISEADKRLNAAIEKRMAGEEVQSFDKGGRAGAVKAGAKAFKKLFEPNPNWQNNTSNINLPTPGIIVPSKMSEVREAVRNIKGNYGARRVERAADEIPNLEKMFQGDALKEAFTGDNASAMMSLNPAEFEKYAIELQKRREIGPKMSELAKQGEIDKYTVPTDEYIQHLQRLQDGFSDVPYLNITKDEVGLPLKPSVIGHEGRHRSRALAESGAPSSLVKINPRGDLREGMPRRTQEEFIEALKEELELSNRLVLPEVDGTYRRPAVELPDIYAHGGKVQSFDKGGRAGAAKAGLKMASRLLADPAESSMTTSRTRKFGDDTGGNTIIKDVGGNWTPAGDGIVYKSQLERELSRLRKGRHDTPSDQIRQMIANAQARGDNTAGLERSLQEAIQKEAGNKWVDSNLKNYITKQMATEADPVRKLAEEGITAFPKLEDEYGDLSLKRGSFEAKQRRKETGFPEQGVAKSPLAKHYETLADEAINPRKAEKFQKIQALPHNQRPRGTEDMPWVDKLDPESHIYSLSQDADFDRLGFNHIMDVLREDIAAGRIRPEQVNKISMEQAVRRTHQYDEELKQKMLEARAAESATAKVHKEYPEGYKWVQLDQPGQFATESDVMGHSVRGYEPPKGHPDYIDASGESGYDTYGHGGYDAIKSGDAKIYSLRDPKGMSHATVEVGKPKLRTWDDVTKAVGKDKAAALHKEFYDIGADRTDNTEAAMAMFLKNKGIEPIEYISQVKGKQNAAPNEAYLPYIQDLVKSGKWSEVKDIQNTGLMDVEKMTDPTTYAKYLENKLQVPKYATERELEELHNEYLRLAEPRNYKPPTEGMAEGGGAFKKLSFYDKGGITTSGGTFSAEDLGVDSAELNAPIISDKRAKQIKRNAAELWEEGKAQLEKEFQQLGRKGGKKDLAIRVGSQILGGVPDLINLGLEGVDLAQSYIPALSRPESVLDTAGTGDRVPKFKLASEEPWLGSQKFMNKFKEAKLLGENEFPLTELATGFIAPAAAAGALKKGKQAYKGAKALTETPNKRRGGLTAMAR